MKKLKTIENIKFEIINYKHTVYCDFSCCRFNRLGTTNDD